MFKNAYLAIAATMFVSMTLETVANAEAGYLRPLRRAQQYKWHANYSNSTYGQPVALVVPPTAQLQTNWSWGAPSTHFRRIDHQFGREYPGPGPFGAGFRNTPQWPNNMEKFGVHYVRGPWYPTQR